jgi:O-antigen ligase
MTRERLAFGGMRPGIPARPAAAPAPAPAPENAPAPPVHLSRIETWDWAWGGLLIFTVLLFFRPHEQIPMLDALHVGDMAALVGISAMAAINLRRGLPITRVTPELIGILLLGAIILLTISTSYWVTGSLALFFELFVPLALISMLMVNAITSPRRIEQLTTVIVCAFGYMCVRVIFDYMRGVNLMEGTRVTAPVGGFFQNPNDLALNLATFMPLALMNVRRPGPVLWRMFCAAVVLLMLVVIVLTQSRGGAIGTVAMLLTFLFVARLLTPPTIIALVMTLMVALPLAPDAFFNRMASITDASRDPTGSRRERRLLLEQGIGVFMDHPLTGVGLGQFQNFYEPGMQTRWRETHNVLLQVGAEIGIFGLIVFVFLIVRMFAAAWWTRRHLAWIHRGPRQPRGPPPPADGLDDRERYFLQTHGSAMLAAAVGWFVCAMFASVAFNWTFYYVLGLAVAGREVVRLRSQTPGRTGRASRSRVAA